MLRGFGILMLTMTLMGLAFHAVQTALPKVFSLRAGELAGDAAEVGGLIAVVYLAAGFMQFVGGPLADRYPLKPVYLLGLLPQVPALVALAQLAGLPLVAAALLAVFLNASILPAENLLIARYTSAHRRSLAFGVKFVLAFATAPLAVVLVARLAAWSGEFVWLFALIATLSALAFLAATALPGTARMPALPASGAAAAG